MPNLTASIAGRRLAELTQVRYDTLRFTLRRPKPIDPQANAPRYAAEEVDAWLADAARYFARSPQLADLVSGTLELVDIREATRLAPRFTEARIRKRARQGRISWLKLSPGLVRYSKASILGLNDRPAFYTTAEVCRIFGIRRWATIQQLFVKTGMLEIIEHPDHRGWPAVTPEALISFLPHLLPQGHPQDWIDDRLADPDWPLHMRDAAVYLGRTHAQLYNLVRNGLPFIWSPGKTERLIPHDALLFQIEQEPLTATDVAHIFGVSTTSVAKWEKRGVFACTVHRHEEVGTTGGEQDEDGTLLQPPPLTYRACLLPIIGRCLSPGIKPGIWLTSRERATGGLMTTRDAAAMLGMTQAEIKRAAELGKEIGGIHSPVNPTNWRFSSQRIVRLERRRRQADRQ